MKRILLGFILSFGFLTLSPAVFAQLYWGGSGAWGSAGWSSVNGGPYDASWIANSAAVFNVPNSTITGATVVFSSITANENVAFTGVGTLSTGGTIATITVANDKTVNFGSQSLSVTLGTGFVKTGGGVLNWLGGTFSGGFTLNEGTVIARGDNSLGGGVVRINSGIIASSISTIRDFTGRHSSIIFGGNFTLGSTIAPASSTGSIIFDASVDLGSGTRIITLNGTGTNTFSGIISGAGGLSTGAGSTGTLQLSGVNTYSGSTKLSGGTLILGSADVIPDVSSFIFNGGTLKTGAFSESYSTLNVSENSSIILAPSAQTHTFAASNVIAWTAGKTLTITGWTGGYNGASGTNGKIFVGNSATGLTPQQLSQIKFFNGTINVNAEQLSTGEVVPNASVLPISLTSFTAKPVDKTILLNWKTASEKSNKSFDLQRSADGKNFTTITSINGAGDSDVENSYSFVDENPFAGINYYKLIQYDFNGQSTSKIIEVDSKIEKAKVNVFATHSSVDVNISSPNRSNVKVYLYDLEGSRLAEKSISLTKGNNALSFAQSLTPGIYFVSLSTAEGIVSTKFAKWQ